MTAQHKKIGLFILVDDLRAGAGVSVSAGALIHPPACQRPHARCRSWRRSTGSAATPT